MKLAQSVLPFFLIIQAVPASADALTDFFPPDTKVVFGLRVHNIVISGLAQTMATQAQAAGFTWLKMVSIEGFDPLRDIDEVMLASTAEGQTPPALIVVAGRFDVARLGEGARRYHGVPLLGGEKDVDSVVALLDGSTALAGDPVMVRAAIDRRAAGTHIDAVLNDRVTSLRQRYDIWGLGQRSDGFPAPVPEAKGLESIDRFQFGVQLAAGLELGAELHARSPKDAEKLTESLQLIFAMLKPPASSGSGATFDLQADGGTVKLNVSIPAGALKKMLQGEKDAAPEAPATLPAVTLDSTTAPAALEATQDKAALLPAAPPLTRPAAGAPVESLVAPAEPYVMPNPTPVLQPMLGASAPPSEVPKPLLKAVTSQVFDKEGNTVVLKLPGKK